MAWEEGEKEERREGGKKQRREKMKDAVTDMKGMRKRQEKYRKTSTA